VCEVLSISGYASIEKLYDFLESGDPVSGLKEIQELYADGFDLINFNKNFLEFLRKKMIESVESGNSSKTVWLLKVIEYFQESHNKSRFAIITQLPLEIAVVQSCLIGEKVETTKREHQSLEKPVKTAAPVKPEAPEIPAVAEVPAPIAPPTTPPITEKSEDSPLTEENFKKQWAFILDAITIPASKRAFSQASLSHIEGHDVYLNFSAQFYLGKILEPPNKIALEKAIEDTCGVAVKIIGKVDENAAPVVAPKKNLAPETSEESDAEDKILGIFGGEMV
jgi:DNA polymerase III gamma/tau subunit